MEVMAIINIQAALVACTGRPTWKYSDLSTGVHAGRRVITCRPGWGHIVAAARIQLVLSNSVALSLVLF